LHIQTVHQNDSSCDHLTTRFQILFVICSLGLAMFKAHTKFEMSTITCNGDMKRNAKCKNFRFEPTFGGLPGNAQGSPIWLDGKRIVDCLVVVIKRFSRALTAAALLSEICRNRRFLMRWVNLSSNFRSTGTSPAIYL